MNNQVTDDLRKLFAEWMEVNQGYPINTGYYDRTHSDNVKLGKRWAKLTRAILAGHGNIDSTVMALADDYSRRMVQATAVSIARHI